MYFLIKLVLQSRKMSVEAKLDYRKPKLNLHEHLIVMLPEIFCGVHKVANFSVRPSV
jgi:hypothetical protein